MTDPEIRRFTPSLRHGDLWYDHLLVDEPSGRLLGVVDWEAAALGDPARDFATQFHLGDDFAEATLVAYRRPAAQTWKPRAGSRLPRSALYVRGTASPALTEATT